MHGLAGGPADDPDVAVVELDGHSGLGYRDGHGASGIVAAEPDALPADTDHAGAVVQALDADRFERLAIP